VVQWVMETVSGSRGGGCYCRATLIVVVGEDSEEPVEGGWALSSGGSFRRVSSPGWRGGSVGGVAGVDGPLLGSPAPRVIVRCVSRRSRKLPSSGAPIPPVQAVAEGVQVLAEVAAGAVDGLAGHSVEGLRGRDLAPVDLAADHLSGHDRIVAAWWSSCLAQLPRPPSAAGRPAGT